MNKSQIARGLSSSSPTMSLAQYVSTMTFDCLPAAVVDATKLLILDNVGCAVAGLRTSLGSTIQRHFESLGGAPCASVFGGGRALPATAAAHVNGFAAAILSFDDSYIRLGHPGTATIPAAIAIAEHRRCSGKDLIAAVVTGYEVSLRIGEAIRPSSERAAQCAGLATWQIFGAASAAARLYGFDAEQVAETFGLTIQHAPVPFLKKFHSRPMSSLKNNYGWANAGALMAAAFVDAGLAGNRTVLDGDTGFWRMAGSDRCDFDVMTADLYEKYRILDVGLKPYGCCRWVHTALDALRMLIAGHDIEVDQVVNIEITSFEEIERDFCGDWPSSVLEAQFHLPYLMSLEFYGLSSAKGLREEDLVDARLKSFAPRVTVKHSAEADRGFRQYSQLPVQLVVTLSDGSQLTAFASIPTGAPGGPSFSREDAIEKFLALTSPTLGERASALCEAILDLDQRDTESVFLNSRLPASR